jgi:phosphoglycerate dehydrogenase-like enzyme
VSDVFEKEPLDSESELWKYENLVITPHIAGGYHLDSAYEAFIDLCVENLTRYKEGRKLLNIVEERFD